MKVGALRIARWGLFSALCVVGSLLPFPSPIGTIAFDSFPGYLAALYFGPLDGAVVCAIGHLATSVVHGFPLGPWHILIALGMAIVGAVVGVVNAAIPRKWGFAPAATAGVVVNTALFPLAVPVLGWEGSLALIPFLAVASALNAALAVAVYVALRRVPS